MGELHEIVDVSAVGKLFALLAVAGPIIGIAVGVVLSQRSKGAKVGRGAIIGLLIGLIGPLNLFLWRVFNAITDANGLDTVRNLGINVAVFAALGIAIGFILRQVAPRFRDSDSGGSGSNT